MQILLTFLIGIFYIFFFVRNIFLSAKIGKSVKNKDILANLAILFSAINTLYVLLKVWWAGFSFSLYTFSFYGYEILQIVALCFIVFGIAISIIASLGLGKSWRVGVDEANKTELVKTGIYSLNRNPYFSAWYLVYIGFFLYVPNLENLILVLLNIIVFHKMVLHEEKYLAHQIGEEYLEYCKKVKRYGLI